LSPRFHGSWVLEIRLGLRGSSDSAWFFFFNLISSYFISYFSWVLFSCFLWFYSIRLALYNYFFNFTSIIFRSINILSNYKYFSISPLWFFNLSNLILILLIAIYFFGSFLIVFSNFFILRFFFLHILSSFFLLLFFYFFGFWKFFYLINFQWFHSLKLNWLRIKIFH
jgi:hypothetical protein